MGFSMWPWPIVSSDALADGFESGPHRKGTQKGSLGDVQGAREEQVEHVAPLVGRRAVSDN